MTKNCPKCGKELPDNAKFCMDCGYSIESKGSSGNSVFPLPTIFIGLIIAVLVIGGVFILTSNSNSNDNPQNNVNDVAEERGHVVDLTISNVDGWDSDSGSKTSYTLYTDAIFNSVPDDLKGYNVKTIYYDSHDKEIGHTTEKLDNIYYDSSYALTLGYYNTYKLPDPDHVTVEIIKDGKVVDNYTEKIDTDGIDFLN